MKPCLLLLAACWFVQGEAQAHDIITTSVTWTRDISRIVNNHCASCHHPGGKAFSLMTFADARPWTVAIKEEILRRRMPPWGAIKGFGEFRNDTALTPEEMERIVSWSDGGVPEGDEKDLPPPPKSLEPEVFRHAKGELSISGDFALFLWRLALTLNYRQYIFINNFVIALRFVLRHIKQVSIIQRDFYTRTAF